MMNAEEFVSAIREAEKRVQEARQCLLEAQAIESSARRAWAKAVHGVEDGTRVRDRYGKEYVVTSINVYGLSGRPALYGRKILKDGITTGKVPQWVGSDWTLAHDAKEVA